MEVCQRLSMMIAPGFGLRFVRLGMVTCLHAECVFGMQSETWTKNDPKDDWASLP
jgi:hypothetical protein